MPRTDGKPAGWKSAEGAFWLRNKDGVAQQKCKQCMRVSAEGCPPILAHERTCDEYPRESVVRGPDLPPRLTLGAVEQMRQAVEPMDEDEGQARHLRTQAAALRSQPKQGKPEKSDAYRRWCKRGTCCNCGAYPCDPHHEDTTISALKRGVGTRRSKAPQPERQ